MQLNKPVLINLKKIYSTIKNKNLKRTIEDINNRYNAKYSKTKTILDMYTKLTEEIYRDLKNGKFKNDKIKNKYALQFLHYFVEPEDLIPDDQVEYGVAGKGLGFMDDILFLAITRKRLYEDEFDIDSLKRICDNDLFNGIMSYHNGLEVESMERAVVLTVDKYFDKRLKDMQEAFKSYLNTLSIMHRMLNDKSIAFKIKRFLATGLLFFVSDRELLYMSNNFLPYFEDIAGVLYILTNIGNQVMDYAEKYMMDV